MTINPHRRLDSETFDIEFGSGGISHKLSVSLARDADGNLREMMFVKRGGKIGQDLDLAFQHLGIQLSRCIQGRDPMTGRKIG